MIEKLVAIAQCGKPPSFLIVNFGLTQSDIELAYDWPSPACTPQSEALDSEQSGYGNRLVGVWSLVTYTDEHEDSDDTQPFGPHPQGFLIYTALKDGKDWHIIGGMSMPERTTPPK